MMSNSSCLDDRALRAIKIIIEMHEDVSQELDPDWHRYRIHCHHRKAMTYYRTVLTGLQFIGVICTREVADAVWAELKRYQKHAIAADTRGTSPKIPPLTGRTSSRR